MSAQWLAEVIAEHEAEWRGDETVGRVRWICVCKVWRGDDRTAYRAHLADVLHAAVVERVRGARDGARDAVQMAYFEAGVSAEDIDALYADAAVAAVVEALG